MSGRAPSRTTMLAVLQLMLIAAAAACAPARESVRTRPDVLTLQDNGTDPNPGNTGSGIVKVGDVGGSNPSTPPNQNPINGPLPAGFDPAKLPPSDSVTIKAVKIPDSGGTHSSKPAAPPYVAVPAPKPAVPQVMVPMPKPAVPQVAVPLPKVAVPQVTVPKVETHKVVVPQRIDINSVRQRSVR
jgi:hypothetical protein